MRRDRRLRQIETRDFTASEGFSLPEDFGGLIDLYHDGSTHYGRIKIVDPEELSERKLRHGDTGVPRYVAVIDSAGTQTLRFAPEPSGTYTLRMVYESELAALDDDEQTTNWLLDAAPDLYLQACMVEANLYLLDAPEAAVWDQRYTAGAEAFKQDKIRRTYGGSLTPRPRNVIGEAL